MAVKKRESINDSIVKELYNNYPLVSAKNGVAYKQKLEYLTFEIDFLNETAIRDLRSIYKHTLITFIFFIRTKMCANGWYTRVDGNHYTYLIADVASSCGISKAKAEEILNACIEKKVFVIVSDESVMEGKLLTCCQQVFNYEMAANNRKRARRDNSQETSEETYTTETPVSVNTTYIPPVSIPPDFVRVDSDDPFGISKM